MAARIFVDVRRDGVILADRLRRLGFKVREFVPHRPHRPLFSRVGTSHLLPQSQGLLRLEFSADNPIWSSNQAPLKTTNAQSECEVMADQL